MSPQIVQTIATALNVNPFKDAQRSTPTLNAQDALSGITHYCDPGTLRYHHSRIVGAGVVSSGAFYKVVETCSQDYQNTRRGYRVVLFDLTGEAVYRPKLDDLTRTREQADRAFWEWFNQFDEVNYYRGVIARKAERLSQQAVELHAASQVLANEAEAPKE